jgi:hypothetical protein
MELTVPKGTLERDRDDIRAFYVRYLLPIWFDVQVIESASGRTAERRWTYGSR